MPTALKIGKFRFFFFSRERMEPIHIHIESDDKYAKFWLEPVSISKSTGYSAKELKEIRRLILENLIVLKEKWYEHFDI
jgi:Domain of unknown function (DUF4160)